MIKPQITRRRTGSRVARPILIFAATSLLALALQSCSVLRNLNEGVLHPVTPEESKAQVVDAARDIVRTLNLQGVSAIFSHESCNDQGEAPFNGRIRLDYNHASTLEESRAEVQQMVAVLQQHGWSGLGDFHSHAPAVSRNDVVAVFDFYSPVQKDGGFIEIWGECRDMTTTRGTMYEPIPVEQLR